MRRGGGSLPLGRTRLRPTPSHEGFCTAAKIVICYRCNNCRKMCGARNRAQLPGRGGRVEMRNAGGAGLNQQFLYCSA